MDRIFDIPEYRLNNMHNIITADQTDLSNSSAVMHDSPE